jgi:hypothetical protein
MRQEIKKWELEYRRFVNAPLTSDSSSLQVQTFEPVRAVTGCIVYSGCAIHKRGVAALYVPGAYGRFHYQGSKRLGIDIRTMRAENDNCLDTTVIPHEDIAEETCAWCGTVGKPILCPHCGSLSCWGKSKTMYPYGMRNTHFRCHCERLSFPDGYRANYIGRADYIGVNVR